MDEIFFLGGDKHEKGKKNCLECVSGYPKKCRCGGLIHANHRFLEGMDMPKVDILCEGCGNKFRKKITKEDLPPTKPKRPTIWYDRY
jgi:hypothetical protein